ncbi:hypothetical protein F4775DRAFT_595735 [Biscogniauxia sp. FL1348]|nr:hypothetical protein F4775DRAFT_595735 [Biscogniauxia sp. FL1348]
MAGKGTSATSPAKEPVVTQRDMAILVAAIQSMKTIPQIDYEEFANLAGFKNARSASTIWSNMRKKYGIGTVASGNGNEASHTSALAVGRGGIGDTITVATTPRKRKGGSGQTTDESPLKKLKTPTKVAADDNEDESKALLKVEDDDGDL